MTARTFRRWLLGAFVVSASLVGFGFVVQPISLWSDGSVQLQLRLGVTPGYGDGSHPNSTAIEAARVWNPFMRRVQLAWTSQPTGEANLDNARNEVAFSSSIFGYSFGRDVLAVALISSDESRRTEADVLVNREVSWNSYRGALRRDTVDLRRVLVHEFGHVLGLGHPDQAGEAIESIMNAYVGDTELPTTDDMDGVGTLYGRGASNPALPLSVHPALPSDQTAAEGQWAQFLVEVTAGSRPWFFQWKKDGIDIPGAIQRIYELTDLKLSDAGRYSVVVRNEAGSITSREATLAVSPAERPTFGGTDTLVEIYLGGERSFYVSAGGTSPISYQWRKDGVDIPGATSQWYGFPSATAQDAGVYTAVAKNAAGSATSAAFTVMVLPIPAPPQERVFVSYGFWNGRADSIGCSLSPGLGPYSYQWYRNGVLIPGADRAELDVFPASGPAEYHVTVGNRGGTTASLAMSYVPARETTMPVADWLAIEQHENIAYLLFAQPARIERLDIATGTWLTPIALAREPRTLAVDASGLYVAFGSSVSRFSLGGQNEAVLFSTDTVVENLLLDAAFIFALAPRESPFGVESRFLSFRRSDGNVVDAGAHWLAKPSAGTVSLAWGERAVFGWNLNSSATTPVRLDFGEDGRFAGYVNTANEENLPRSTRTFVTTDGAHVVSDNGAVFRANDLHHVASLGRRFDDLTMLADGSCITVGFGELRAYDASFKLTGRMVVPEDCARVVVANGFAVAIARTAMAGERVAVTRVKLSDFRPPPVAPVLDPVLAASDPSAALLDSRGVVHLLDPALRNVFRWSPSSGYLDSWGLTGVANHLAYSPALNRFFVAYADGRLTQLTTDGRETPVMTSSAVINELVGAGERVLVRDDYSIKIFDLAGHAVGDRRYAYSGWHHVFDPLSQRLFYLSDTPGEPSPSSRALQADGTLGPTAIGLRSSDSLIRPPLRVSPDGRSVGVAGGRLFAADTLIQRHSLPYPVGDLAWLGARLFTARDSLDGLVVERWTAAAQARDAVRVFEGKLVRLFTLPDGRLLLISLAGNRPRFTILDAELHSTAPVLPVFTTQPAGTAAAPGKSLTLSAAADQGQLRWSRDGVSLLGQAAAAWAIESLQPAHTGLYAASVSSGAGSATSHPAIVGLVSADKVTGAGWEIGPDILHPNGNAYDQVLMQHAAVAVTADATQVTRTSFVDDNGDIVQVEFSGAGTLSLVLAHPSGPATAVNYNQPEVSYMKGHVGLVIANADETTNVSVFTVGRATAFDPTGAFNFLRPIGPSNEPFNNGSPLFQGRDQISYDGIADLSYVAILSRNGRFGGVRAANARFSSVIGSTGIYAPGVRFEGPVWLGNVQAHVAARPVVVLGEADDVRIAGGDLFQPNGMPVQVSGFTRMAFAAGVTSHGTALPARRNRARLEQDGVDVTAQIVADTAP